jgi:oxygen-independent coproporphyrinogen-3 oxidase
MERAGYHVGSAYTAVKDPSKTTFVYRDRLWQGADMAGARRRVVRPRQRRAHAELDTWETYVAAIDRGQLPLAAPTGRRTRNGLIRELVLQLKLGTIKPPYFEHKYGVNILERFADAVRVAGRRGLPEVGDENAVSLTRQGLLRVDVLLPRFFLPNTGHPVHLV